MQPDAGPLLIGWREYIDFVDWGVRHVSAKIDTGARTSALAADGARPRPVRRTCDGNGAAGTGWSARKATGGRHCGLAAAAAEGPAVRRRQSGTVARCEQRAAAAKRPGAGRVTTHPFG